MSDMVRVGSKKSHPIAESSAMTAKSTSCTDVLGDCVVRMNGQRPIGTVIDVLWQPHDPIVDQIETLLIDQVRAHALLKSPLGNGSVGAKEKDHTGRDTDE